MKSLLVAIVLEAGAWPVGRLVVSGRPLSVEQNKAKICFKACKQMHKKEFCF